MSSPWKNLKERTLSALLLGAAILFIVWWDPVSFEVILLLAVFLLMREWMMLTRTRHTIFIPLGVIYIVMGCFSLAIIRRIYGWEMIYFIFAMVWIGDVAAYLVGSRFGRHKIAPSISPGKSWEGLAASLIATVGLCVGVLSLYYHYQPAIHGVIIGASFAILGLVGDIFESSLKRKAGVKDSGNLIPGHGGLFDRVDALLPCSILAAILLFY